MTLTRAKELTRVQIAVVINVPGAAQPTTIVTLHNKAEDSPVAVARFRQAVELARLREYLNESGLDSSDNIIVLGDFNLKGSPATFTSEPIPMNLPVGWNRGTDIPLPISYSPDPDFHFPAPFSLTALDARALDNNSETTFAGSTFDFILTSPAIITKGSEFTFPIAPDQPHATFFAVEVSLDSEP